jgi:hypothetical protein
MDDHPSEVAEGENYTTSPQNHDHISEQLESLYEYDIYSKSNTVRKSIPMFEKMACVVIHQLPRARAASGASSSRNEVVVSTNR